jgi:hypothetical protein
MISIRCSSLPLLFACRPALEGDLQIDERNEASDLGSAAHEAMEAIVAGVRPDLDAIAKRWSCNRDELGRLSWYGTKAWEVLATSFPDDEEHARLAESEVCAVIDGEIRLPGHMDMHTICSDGTARTVDWKSGRVDKDFYHQLAGYAAGLMADPHIHQVTASVVWLRAQEIETYVITRAVLEQWMARLKLQLSRTAYSTGRHCEFCPRGHSCPAKRAKAAEGIAILTGEPAVSLEGLPSADIVALYRRARLVERVAESMVASIRLHVIQHGPQDSGDGTALQVVEENGGRDIDVGKAWDIIQDRLPDASAMASVLRVSATALDDAVAKAAGKGKGAAAKRDLAAELEAAGAVTMKKISKLSEKRIPPKEIA